MSGRVLEWAVQLDVPMSHATFRVLAVLAKHADDDGSNAYPSLDRIQALAQAQRTTVTRALAELEKLGVISREKGGGRTKSTQYRINLTLGKASETVASRYPLAPETGASSYRSKPVNGSATLPFKAKKAAKKGSMTHKNSSVIAPDSIQTLGKKGSTSLRDAPPAQADAPSPAPEQLPATAGQGQPAGSAATLPAGPSARHVLFGHTLWLVRHMTGKPDTATRKLLGFWLKNAGDDADLVNRIVQDAADQRVIGPEAWITAAVQARGPKRGSFTQAQLDRQIERQIRTSRDVDAGVLAVVL